MKKIFYSMMAVALCACSQSEVDDMGNAPQPENNGLKFEVVDNGFVGEDGTRVKYGEYGTADAYHATFEEGDAIGLYAIKSGELAEHWYGGMYPQSEETSYTVKNVKLTLTNGVWKSESAIDFGDADLLFAYAPYRADAAVTDDYEPTFKGETGNWVINTESNRFFVGGNTYDITDNSGDKFKANDWMGAAVNLKGGEQTITFEMQHMRGMVELTTHKNVTLEDLTLAIGSDNGTKYHFTPYHIETADKNVYRILTTEYRSVNTIYATIQDVNIVKKYKKTPKETTKGAGLCVKVNIDYTPAETITVDADHSLASILTTKYGANYATAPVPALTSLRLAGTLSDTDWATLKSLTTLTTLDMYQLNNTEIPSGWLNDAPKLKETLTTLVLPNKLVTIPWNSLQVKHVANIDLPATVKTIGNGAFYYCEETSFCIPANSQLTSIGDGAFWNAKAVYTDAIGVLKIPAGVTEILNNAFLGVKNLNKIIFQSTEAPTIGGTNTFGGINAMIYVPNKENYYGKSMFPGKTVIVGPILTAENYVSPNTNSSDGQGLPALCDNNIDTYWHTIWSGSGDATYGQYIDITLPEGATMSSLMIQYVTRKQNSNAVPEIIDIYTSTDGTWGEPLFTLTKEANSLPTANGASFTSEKVTATAPFTKIRFAITKSALGLLTGGASSQSTSLAELAIGEEIWTE